MAATDLTDRPAYVPAHSLRDQGQYLNNIHACLDDGGLRLRLHTYSRKVIDLSSIKTACTFSGMYSTEFECDPLDPEDREQAPCLHTSGQVPTSDHTLLPSCGEATAAMAQRFRYRRPLSDPA